MEDASAPAPARWVTCPTCKGESLYSSANKFRPFCSERCKNIDLGAWASESFAVPDRTPPEDQQLDQLGHLGQFGDRPLQ